MELYTAEFHQLLSLAKPVEFSAEPDPRTNFLLRPSSMPQCKLCNQIFAPGHRAPPISCEFHYCAGTIREQAAHVHIQGWEEIEEIRYLGTKLSIGAIFTQVWTYF